MHEKLIGFVIRAPINLFFDVTPIGKILSRFSKNLEEVDRHIFHRIHHLIECCFSTLAVMAVATYTIP